MPTVSRFLIDDRRSAPRSSASLSAYVITKAGHPLRGVTINLSRSGVFVETKARCEWRIGETARLVLALSEGNMVRLARYSVLVVRETQSGIGLAFWRSPRSNPIQSEGRYRS